MFSDKKLRMLLILKCSMCLPRDGPLHFFMHTFALDRGSVEKMLVKKSL